MRGVEQDRQAPPRRIPQLRVHREERADDLFAGVDSSDVQATRGELFAHRSREVHVQPEQVARHRRRGRVDLGDTRRRLALERRAEDGERLVVLEVEARVSTRRAVGQRAVHEHRVPGPRHEREARDEAQGVAVARGTARGATGASGC